MTKPVCAIIGAGEGLGRALALKFASNGFDLGLVSRTRDGCNAAIEAAAKGSGQARFFSADVAQPDSVESAIADIRSTLGEITILIRYMRKELSRFLPSAAVFVTPLWRDFQIWG